MRLNSSVKIILVGIIILGAALRFYGLNWDQGHNLHPDERAIILTVLSLQPPTDSSNFFSPDSPWNPNFFAYGSFPIYLLYFAAQLAGMFDPRFANYDYIAIVGRLISSFADLITVFTLFLLGRKLFNVTIGLLSASLYAISVLPIQLSHFFVVDTLLTMFVVATIYLLIFFYEKPSVKKSFLLGFFFGLSLATKVSAVVLVASIGVSLVVDFLLIFLKQPHKPKDWLPHLPTFIKHLIRYGLIILITTVITFVFFEPYAFIDFKNFWLQTMQQQAMTKDAFTFPYTLQYVGKIPYIYELKNIFLFGLGPVIAILSFIGIIYFVMLVFKKSQPRELILLTFFFVYFFVVGKFAIGFMRYMLPLYPLFCLFAALSIYKTVKKIENQKLSLIFHFSFIILLLIWPLSFIQIYNKNNTRVDATNWILENIPQGKMLLVEHWDDRLPVINSEKYLIEDLELYNSDDNSKWQKINNQLDKADYIIIASNRLYTPLQKLTNCNRLPVDRCYVRTAMYYQELFLGKLKFKKIKEFSSYPTVLFLNIKINDQNADESFTVYDHPKVMIFKKR